MTKGKSMIRLLEVRDASELINAKSTLSTHNGKCLLQNSVGCNFINDKQLQRKEHFFEKKFKNYRKKSFA